MDEVNVLYIKGYEYIIFLLSRFFTIKRRCLMYALQFLNYLHAKYNTLTHIKNAFFFIYMLTSIYTRTSYKMHTYLRITTAIKKYKTHFQQMKYIPTNEESSINEI